MKNTKTLLLVDDEENFLLSLSEGLGNAMDNVHVITAPDGRKAVEILKSSPVDLLVTDLHMPVMNGFELLTYILKNHPHLPAIVMTAFANDDVIGRLRSLGYLHYIEKPLEFEDLMGKIQNIFENGPGSYPGFIF